MKLYAKKGVIRHEPNEVRCNVCGKAVARNEWGYFMDYISLSKAWGFHSPFDGEAHDMDVCVDCYSMWIKEFNIPPVRVGEDAFVLG